MAETLDEYAYEGMIIGKITTHGIVEDMTEYLDTNSARIRCSVLGNDTNNKLKIVDKR